MQHRYSAVLVLAVLGAISSFSAIAASQNEAPSQPATVPATTTPVTTTPAATTPAATPSKFKFALALGSDEGGETLMSGVYTGGGKWDIRSNAGVVVKAGIIIPVSAFETHIMAGYKSDTTSASNGKVGFRNYQLEVLEMYHPNDFQIGLGLAYIVGSQLEVNMPSGTSNGTYKFKDTVGGIIQVGWAPQNNIFSLDLRYTAAKLTPSNFTAASFTGAKSEYSGNVIGLIGSIRF